MLAFSDRPSLNGLIIFFFSVSTEQSIFVTHRALKIGKNSTIMINHFMSGVVAQLPQRLLWNSSIRKLSKKHRF